MNFSEPTRPDARPDSLIFGIDIGGTKTHLRAMPAAGGAARDLVLPSADWRRRDWDADAAALLEMVARLAGELPVAALAVGAHGCDDAEECRAFQSALAARIAVPLTVVNDAELMPLALGLHGQIGVVAGTGSIAVCRSASGEMLVAGGWGWIVGDEGSAASLVREAVRAVARHFDEGGGWGEPLVEAMFEALAVPSIPRLGSALSLQGSAAAVGRHAVAVFDAADQGSALALQVIREGGRGLARLVALLDRRGAGATHAVAGGSVIVSQPRLWQAFIEGLAELTPGRLTPHLFTGKPVEGACRLAASLIHPRQSRAGTLPLRASSRPKEGHSMRYRSTIARQPEALADTYASVRKELAEVDISVLDRPVIGVTGIGASFAAAVVGAAELQAKGRRAFAIRAVDMADGHNLCDALVGLSHRGRSVETVAALEKLPTARRLAITNDADSPLAKAADLHLRLNNGSDATPSSTGYTATLLAMGMAFEKLLGNSSDTFAAIPKLVGEVLAAVGNRMERLGKLFPSRRAIDCVGAGASLGTADGASLLLREAARIPTSAYDTRHYLHGPMESMDGTTGVVLFGADREIELAQHLDRIGCPALLVTTADVADGELLTVVKVPKADNLIAQGILDILTAQLFAAELSDAAGLTDTKFRYRMSDTKVPMPEAV